MIPHAVCGALWDATATFRTHTKPLATSSTRLKLLTAILLATAVAAGFAGGVVFSHTSSSNRARLRLAAAAAAASDHRYQVLSSSVWASTPYGSNCSGLRGKHSKGLEALCRLPSIWKDCSGGIYLDIVSAVQQ